MSIINQMLRDLDSRRGPNTGAQITALQGMGLIGVNRLDRKSVQPFLLHALMGFLAALVAYQAYIWWDEKASSSVQTPEVSKISTEGVPDDTPEPAERMPVLESQTIYQATDEPHPEKTTAVTDDPAASTEGAKKVQPEAVVQPAVKVLSPEQRADRLFSQAQHAIGKDDSLRAADLLRTALSIHKQHIEARVQLATLLISGGVSDEAERLLAEGLDISPPHSELALPYARLLVDKGQNQHALNILDGVLHLNGADSEALALRAAIFSQLGRYGDARKDYQRAVMIQPERALWWVGLGISLERVNLPETALHAYQSAARLSLDKPVMTFVNERIHSLQTINNPY